jgi:two-component system nitrate/nitrite response regulator NarL
MRVLVADSLELYRSGVRNVLERESDFEVLEASDVDELRAAVAERCPNIVIVDLDLPPVGGVAAIGSLNRCPDTRAVVWSFEPTRETVLAAIRGGADGYLHKEITPQGLIAALRGVARGEAALSRDLARLMIEAIHGLERRDRVRDRASVLSTREREVLAFVARGARNKDIADALTISEFTVKRHMQNILQKLEMPSRRAAASFYRSAFQNEGLRQVGGAHS